MTNISYFLFCVARFPRRFPFHSFVFVLFFVRSVFFPLVSKCWTCVVGLVVIVFWKIRDITHHYINQYQRFALALVRTNVAIFVFFALLALSIYLFCHVSMWWKQNKSNNNNDRKLYSFGPISCVCMCVRGGSSWLFFFHFGCFIDACVYIFFNTVFRGRK